MSAETFTGHGTKAGRYGTCRRTIWEEKALTKETLDGLLAYAGIHAPEGTAAEAASFTAGGDTLVPREWMEKVLGIGGLTGEATIDPESVHRLTSMALCFVGEHQAFTVQCPQDAKMSQIHIYGQ